MDTDPPLTSLCVAGALLCNAAAGQTCDLTFQAQVENIPGFGPSPVSDTELAVGEERVLACSNSWFTLYDKSGNVVDEAEIGNHPNPTASNPFFLTNTVHADSTIGDPVVYYDYHSERFWIVAVEGRFYPVVPESDEFFPVYSHFHIAVSTSSTPVFDADSWMRFDYEVYENKVSGTYNPTGPFTLPSAQAPCIVSHNEMIAVDQHSLYITSFEELFFDPTSNANRHRTGVIYAFDKASLLSNTLPTPQVFKPFNTTTHDTWGEVAAVEYGFWDNTHPAYTVVTGLPPQSSMTSQQDTIVIGALTRNPSTGVYTYDTFDLTGGGLPTWNNAPDPIATPSGNNMNLIAGRFLHATYVANNNGNGGRIYCTHHIANPSDSTRSIVRWYEIETRGWPYSTTTPNTPILVQYGDIADTGSEGLSYFDPAIAVDAYRTIGLTWTQCGDGTGEWPDFWMGARKPSDTAGTIPFKSLRQAHTASLMQSFSNKWDYSGCEPDPTEPCRFWGHSPLVLDSDQWQSYVSRVCVPCEPPSSESLSQPADFNCDGVSDTLDALIFADLISKGSKAADLDGSGAIDAGDLKEFEALMAKGQRK